MVRLFKHYVPNAVLLLGVLDFALLLIAAEGGWRVRAWQIGMAPGGLHTRIPQLLSFAVPLQIAMVAVGAYGADTIRSLRVATSRLMVAVSLGILLLSVIFFLVPAITFWRSNLFYAMLLSIAMLFALRLVAGRTIGGDVLRRRVVVLGAGARAARIAALAERASANFSVIDYIAMNDGEVAVGRARRRDTVASLPDHVLKMRASEVVLAMEERRNALPLNDLLRIKTTGVMVCDISTFIERETGRVDLASVNPSWLIFSDGFSSGQMLNAAAKRSFDIAVSLILLVVTAPLLMLVAIAIRLETPGPALYRQRRVGLHNEEFVMMKLRSMREDAACAGGAVWTSERDPRITRIGQLIRKIRFDELPQCWSVLTGDMSFVGPRPERPEFVAGLERELPFYAERHMVKPGITGWAQINYPYGASVEDARHKLEYDLYYAKNYSPFLDLLILIQTLRVVLWPQGAR